MSKEIDERVVSMRLENEDFEKNAETSMATLDKLNDKLKMKDASDGLENIGKAAETVKVQLSAMQIAGATAIAELTNSAIDAGKRMTSIITSSIIEGGKRRALNIEQAKFQLEGLGVAWDTIKDDINYGVKDTAYGLDAAAKVASQLVASQVQVGEQMRGALRGISGVAAMTSSEYEEIGQIFTTIAGNGRVMSMQLTQLASRGLNAAAAMAKYFGRTEEEIRKFVSKGCIDFEMFADAMDWAFGDHAKEANKTFEGALSNTKAALSRIGADVATPAYNGMRDALNALIPVIDNLHTALAPVISDASTFIGTWSSSVVNKFNKISNSFSFTGLDNLKNKVVETGIAFEDFQNGLITVAKEHGIAIDEMIEKEGSFERTLSHGWLTSGIFSETLNKFADGALETSEAVSEATSSVAELQTVVRKVIRGDFGNGKKRMEALTNAGYDFAMVQDLVNKTISGQAINYDELSDAQLKNIGYTEEQIELMRSLAAEAEKTNTPVSELIENMGKPNAGELVIDTIRNSISALAKGVKTLKDAWSEVFSSSNTSFILTTLTAVNNFSKKLVMSDETADKLKRTLKGVFSTLDLIRSIISGGLRIGLQVINGVLSVFHTDIFSVSAAIGDAITKFRDWYKEHDFIANAITKTAVKLAEWIKKIKEIPALQKIISNFHDKFKIFFENSSGYFREFGERLSEFFERVKLLDELTLDNVKLVFKDFWNNIIRYVFNFDGVINNTKNAISDFKRNITEYASSTEKGLGGVKDAFIAFAEFVKSKLPGLSIASILTIGIGTGLITAVSLIKKTLKLLATPYEHINKILENTADVLSGVKNVLGAFTTKIKSEALRNVAISIGVLAASVFVLAQLDTTKMWSSVGALVALSAALAGISVLMGKVSKNAKLSVNIMAIAAAVLLFVNALQKLDKLDTEHYVSAFLKLSALVGLITVSTGLLSRYAPGVSKCAASILAIALSVLILTKALENLNDINTDSDTVRSLGAIIASLATLMAATRIAGKSATSAGKSMLAISSAVFIMSVVFKNLNKITINENRITALVIIVGTLGALMIAVRLAGDKAADAGKGLLSLTASIAILAITFDNLDRIEITKDKIEALASVMVALAGLMLMTRLAKGDAKNAGSTVLLAATSIAIIAGAMMLLSKIDENAFGRVLGAIVILEAAFAGLIAVTKLASDCKGALLTLTMVIGALLVSVGVLSMTDPNKLTTAAEVMAIIIDSFAILIAASGVMKKAAGTIVSLGAVIVALGLVVGGLAKYTDTDRALKAAEALSLLILSLSGALVLLNMAPEIKNSSKMLGSIAIVSGVIAGLALVLGVLNKLDIGTVPIETAKALSLLITALSGAMILLGISDIFDVSKNKKAVGSLALVAAVVAGLGAILGILNKFGAGTIPIETAKSLSLLVLALSTALIPLSLVGAAAEMALAGIGVFAVFVAALGLLMGALSVVDLSVIEKGEQTLVKIGEGFGSFFGAITKGFTETAAEGLPAIGTSLSEFTENLKPFFEDIKNVDGSSLSAIKTLSDFLLDLFKIQALAEISDFFAGDISISDFGTQLIGFGEALKIYCNTVKDIDTSGVENSVIAGKALAELADAIPNSGGLLGFLAGGNNIDDFGERISSFGSALEIYCNTVKDIDTSGVENSVVAGKALSELAGAIPNSGGLLGFLAGGNNIDDFGLRINSFGSALKIYCNTVKDIDVSGIENSVIAGKALSDLANLIPNSGGLLGFFAGGNNVDDFGERINLFGNALKIYCNTVKDIDTSGVENSVVAGKALAELASVMPISGGLTGYFIGGNNTDGFAKQLSSFSKSLKDYDKDISTIDVERIKATAYAGKTITDVFNDVYKNLDVGSLDFGSLNTVFTLFGQAITTYSNEVNSIDDDALVKTATAGKLLAELFAITSQNGGISNIFKEGTDVETFKAQIKDFVSALVTYSSEAEKIKSENIISTVDACKAFASISATISENGGLKSFFVNEDDSKQFGNQTKSLAIALRDFSDKIGDINVYNFSQAIVAYDELKNLSEKLKDGFVSLPSKEDANNFKTSCRSIGEALMAFNNSVNGLSQYNFSNTIAAYSELKTLSEKLKDGFVSFPDKKESSSFKTKSTEVGKALKEFSDAASNINQYNFSKTTSAYEELKELSEKIEDGLASFPTEDDTSDFKDKIKAFATALSEYSSAAEGIDIDAINASVEAFNIIGGITPTNIADAIKNGILSISEAMSTVINALKSTIDDSKEGIKSSFASIMDDSISEINGRYQSFYDSGKYIAEGLAQGINDNKFLPVQRAAEMAAEAARAAKAELDENSPSKVFDEIGGYTSIGMAEGILTNSESVVQAIRKTTDNAVKSASSGVSTIAGTFEELSMIKPNIKAIEAAPIAMANAINTLSINDLASSAAKYVENLAPGAVKYAEQLAAADAIVNKSSNKSSKKSTSTNSSSSKKSTTSSLSSTKSAEQLEEEAYQAFVKMVDKKRKYGEWSMAQEIAAYKERLNMYKEDTERYNEVYEKIYDLEYEYAVDSIEKRREAGEIDIDRQIDAYEELLKNYKQFSKEYEEISDKIYDLRYESSTEWIENEKFYNRLSLQEELDAWKRVQSRYAEGTEERKEADQKVYELKHELISNSIWQIEQEISDLEKLAETMDKTSIEFANTISEIEYLKKNTLFDAKWADSQNWIDEQQKFNNQWGSVQELAAYRRVREWSKVNTESDAYKTSCEKIRELEQDIYEAALSYEENRKQIEEDGAERRLELEEEYKQKCSEDIESLEKEYEDALKSRSEALYDAYGLFEKLSKPEKVSSGQLIKNLKTQVGQIKDWRSYLDKLEGRGVDSDLIDELQEMGPSSFAQIRALNGMSDNALNEYVRLWREKHQEATDRATDELSDMRESTDKKIAEIEADNSEAYAEFQENLKALDEDIKKQLDDLDKDFKKTMGLLPKYTAEELATINTTVEKFLSEAGFDSLGKQIATSTASGIKESTPVIQEASSGIASTIISSSEEAEPNIKGAGEESAKSYAEGIDEASPSVSNTVLQMTNAARNEIESLEEEMQWIDAGIFMIRGVMHGIDAWKPRFISSLTDVAISGLNTFKDVLGIASPSKEFAEIGRYSDEGFAMGLLKYRNGILAASEKVGQSAFTSFESSIFKMEDLFSEDYTLTPTIRPVVDFSNLSYMDELLNGTHSMQLGGKITHDTTMIYGQQFDDMASRFEKATTNSNERIAEEIGTLRDDIATLADTMRNVKVYIDKNTLVGAISPDMDRKLGQIANMNRRRV